MSSIFEEIIGDFQERDLPDLTLRDAELAGLPGKVDTLIGMRRSGKSWRLFQAMRALLHEGVPKPCLLYINFDDERLYPLSSGDLGRIPDTFYRLFPENKNRRCHFFLDEIQNVDGWERFVRRLLDTEDVQLTLTGSSVKLLSREIATTLRGRSLTAEIFPFSFAEALRHQGIDPRLGETIGGKRRAQLANRLWAYMETGGFPEVQGVESHHRIAILQEYVDVVVLRDVVERHGIGNLMPLRQLIRRLLSAPACAFSINRFYNDLKSQGIACGKNSLHEYLTHLEDAYLVQAVSIDARSERQRQVNPRKVYPIDTGLAQAFHHGMDMDRGRLLETLVFLDLRRRGLEVAWLRTTQGYEVDFVARQMDMEPQLIQVSESLADAKTRERELRALRAAMAERKRKRGAVVTLNEAERLRTAEGEIEIVPAWQWLLRER